MRSAEAPEDARVRVLIAEDHALVRDGIRELLERQSDIEVVGEAADGEEAVQLARQLQPDIVLMDISMPRLNGVEATRIIKQSSPHIAVLVLSAYDDDAYVFAVFEAGAAGYLLKSAKSIEVVDAVRAVWQGDSPLHPSIARKVLRRF
ncbi:MAG TPA: response regulator transcription factor, partial [Dehalococcoidia bacterium]|nr:response regulator transcription factor [Dehalococcoidia bacterium]